MYIGGKKNGKKEGFGIIKFDCGAEFKGYFKNDETLGFGLLQHISGDFYQGKHNNYNSTYLGEFKKNSANGYGIYSKSDKSISEGTWVDDLQQGICNGIKAYLF